MTYEALQSSLQNVNIALEDHILIVTMNRPKALNALNSETLVELEQVISYIAADSEVYGVIVTGEGRAFVAGADISQMQPYKSEAGRDYAGYSQSVFNGLEALDKPVIAAVNGFALGGGCELALSCDIRIASDKAKFGQPEVTLGIIPCFGGTQRLPRLVGPGKAKEMIFTGTMIDAAEAEKIGLVNKVVPAEELLDSAKAMLQTIFKVSPVAVKYAKLSINKGADLDLKNALELEKDLVGLCFATDDKDVGMTAFLQKEKANFRA